MLLQRLSETFNDSGDWRALGILEVLVVKNEFWLTFSFWVVILLRRMRMAMIKMRANASLCDLR